MGTKLEFLRPTKILNAFDFILWLSLEWKRNTVFVIQIEGIYSFFLVAANRNTSSGREIWDFVNGDYLNDLSK